MDAEGSPDQSAAHGHVPGPGRPKLNLDFLARGQQTSTGDLANPMSLSPLPTALSQTHGGLLSPASTYASKHLAKQHMALGKSPRPSAKHDTSEPTQPDTAQSHADQGSTHAASTPVVARAKLQPGWADTQTGYSAATMASMSKISEGATSSSGASTGQLSRSGALPNLPPKSTRQAAPPSVGQRRMPHAMGFGSTSALPLYASTGPDAFGRVSDVVPTAAALERKELLKQYQAQKAAQAGRATRQPQAASAGGAGAGDEHAPSAARRLSAAGTTRVAARPPIPSAQLIRAGTTTSAAAVTHAAAQPLPPGDDHDSGVLEAPASPPPSKAPPHMLLTQRARPSQAHELSAAKALPPVPGRLSLGGTALNPQAPPARAPSPTHPPGRAPSPIQAQGRAHVGPPGSGGGALPSGAQLGGLGSLAGSGGGAGSVDVHGEVRGLRLQELQWRFVNARMDMALRTRKQQGEQALAACVLATSQLERSAAAAAAQQGRQLLQLRAAQAAQALQPLLQPFMQLQAEPGSPDSVLQCVAQGLINSLTSLPLVCGAVCGSVREANLEAMECVMNRGLHALMQIDAALQPLLSASCGGGVGAGAAVDPAGVAAGSSSARVSLPTATILTQLVTHLKAEVHALREVYHLLDVVRSKQLLLNSHQAMLVQMNRKQAAQTATGR